MDRVMIVELAQDGVDVARPSDDEDSHRRSEVCDVRILEIEVLCLPGLFLLVRSKDF